MWVIGEREIGNQVCVSLCVWYVCVWCDLGFRFRGSFVGGCWCCCVRLVGSEVGPGRYHGVGLVLGQRGAIWVFLRGGCRLAIALWGVRTGYKWAWPAGFGVRTRLWAAL